MDSIQVDGQVRVLDWKCANAVWPEYLLQLAAYGALYSENFPETPVEGYDLVRFDKSEHADFAHHSFTSLKDELAQFLLLRKAYEFDLFAVPFNLSKLKTRGSPVPAIEDLTANPSWGAGQFDFSETGTFI